MLSLSLCMFHYTGCPLKEGSSSKKGEVLRRAPHLRRATFEEPLILSYLNLSYLILSYLILSYLIVSYLIVSYSSSIFGSEERRTLHLRSSENASVIQSYDYTISYHIIPSNIIICNIN